MEKVMVRLEGVSKKYDDIFAVKNVTLDIKAGEFLTLLGPSGCGKTTTLRMIAGFEEANSGSIWIDGENMANVEPYHRKVNTVFQSYSLFPHMNVFDNVAFGLKMKKVPKQDIEKRVTEVLKLVQLESFKDRKPHQLSGGQQQRIAIARAIVNNPQVLLLDEPLGALDLKLRKQMQLELKHLQEELNITFIYVTHDQEEALTMSDRIVVMNEGEIQQIGTPQEIYENPTSLFIADFIGETNILEATIISTHSNYSRLNLAGHQVNIRFHEPFKQNELVKVCVRPEKVRLTRMKTGSENEVQVRFKETIYIGLLTKVIMSLADGQTLVANCSNEDLSKLGDLMKGDELFVSWKLEDAIAFKLETSLQPKVPLERI